MSEDWRETAARTHEALRQMWEEEKPAVAPPIHRYVITVECTEEEFESVKLALKGYPMRRRGFHEEPMGGA